MAAAKTKKPAKRAVEKTAAKRTVEKTAAKKATAKKAPAKAPEKREAAPKKHRVFGISFASVYPLYLQKVEKKGRTQAEVDEVIGWLTGYRGAALKRVLDTKLDLETFFARAPRLNPNATRITGVICGMRVEDIADPLMQKIRYLDKLIDELANGKKMASILRE